MKKITILIDTIDAGDNITKPISNLIERNGFYCFIIREFKEDVISLSDLVLWIHSSVSRDIYKEIKDLCPRIICLRYGYFSNKGDVLVSDFKNARMIYRLPMEYEDYLDEELLILINGALARDRI